MASALNLLHTYDYSADPGFSKNGGGFVPTRRVMGGHVISDPGERLELYQAEQKVRYRAPTSLRFGEGEKTPYIQMPYAPFETMQGLPLDFVPVNQFGIHRGFDVPEVNAYHTPVLGNLADIAAQLDLQSKAVAERVRDHTQELIDSYGSHITEKTIKEKVVKLLHEGFDESVVKKALEKENVVLARKHLAHPLKPHNIHSALRTSFVE